MACERFAGDLRAHAAGADATPGLRAHLAACGGCRDALARERSLVGDIDRELADALRLDPSVEFQARVRERIAVERPAPWAFAGWQFALGAAALVLVAGLTATLMLRTGTSREKSVSTTASTKIPAQRPPVAHEEAPVVGQPPVRPAADDGRRQSVVARRPVRVTGGLRPAAYGLRRPKAEPEVLVPPDQRVAIGRLLEMMATGKIDQALLPSAGEMEVAPPAAQVVAPLVVQDMKVPPIEVTAAGSTDKRGKQP